MKLIQVHLHSIFSRSDNIFVAQPALHDRFIWVLPKYVQIESIVCAVFYTTHQTGKWLHGSIPTANLAISQFF
jgi:hypothetical protein